MDKLVELQEKIADLFNDELFVAELKKATKIEERCVTEEELDELKENYSQLKFGLRYLSPFCYSSSEFELIDIAQNYFEFNEKEIDSMSLETKLKLIETGKNSVKKAMRQYRDDLVSEYVMFQDTFEEQKLKVLMDCGDVEPIILTEEDYAYFEMVFVDVVTEIFQFYFKMRVRTKSDEDILMSLRKLFLKKYPRIADTEMYAARNPFLWKLESNEITEEDIREYKEYKTCLLTHNFQRGIIKQEYAFSCGFVRVSYVVLKNLECAKRILSKERLIVVMDYMIGFSEHVKRKVKEGRGIQEMGRYEDVKKAIFLMSNLQVFADEIKRL